MPLRGIFFVAADLLCFNPSYKVEVNSKIVFSVTFKPLLHYIL